MKNERTFAGEFGKDCEVGLEEFWEYFVGILGNASRIFGKLHIGKNYKEFLKLLNEICKSSSKYDLKLRTRI